METDKESNKGMLEEYSNRSINLMDNTRGAL